MNVYVYYDVPVARQHQVRACVDAMQAALGGAAIACRLMRRPEPRHDGSQTWMEVYADVAPAFDDLLRHAVDASGIRALTGARHTERFVDVDRCA